MSNGGFFTTSRIGLKVSESLVPQCGRCGLLDGCESPKMPVAGQGRKRIMVVGEAPGFNEDKQGIPFVGKAGQRLMRTLTKFAPNP